MWRFPKNPADHSNTKSKKDEFFNTQNASTSLVRETIQNSYDAALDKDNPSVIVRFKIKDISAKSFETYFKTEEGLSLYEHLACEDLGKFAFKPNGSQIRSLIIEDEGTTGLTGHLDKNDARSGSSFVGFWWNDGISGKSRGAGGSHGVGKTTLTRVTEMSTFFAITKRSDDLRRFLIGFSNLPYHRISSNVYVGYGRYGLDSGDAFNPIENASYIDGFLSNFSLSRDQSGLTLLIPGIPSDVNYLSILTSSILEFYWPIIRGYLQIEIYDETASQNYYLNADTIAESCEFLINQAVSENQAMLEIKERIKISSEIIKLRDSQSPLWFIGNSPRPETDAKKLIKLVFGKEDFSPENLDLMCDGFQNGELIGYRFKLELNPVTGAKHSGYADLFIKKIEIPLAKRTHFIRKQVIVSNQKSSISARDVACFLIIEDNLMSDYLVLAEEPAHTQWFHVRFNEQKEFKSDAPLRFLMNLPDLIHRILTRDDEENRRHDSVFADIFSIADPSAETTSRRKKRTKKENKRVIIPPPKKRPLIRVDKDQKNTGFKIVSVMEFETILQEEDLSLPIAIEVRAAYVSALGKTRSWKDYSPIDFEFVKNIPIKIEPIDAAELVSANGNKFLINVLKPNFSISTEGFDPNRDLIVQPKIRL